MKTLLTSLFTAAALAGAAAPAVADIMEYQDYTADSVRLLRDPENRIPANIEQPDAFDRAGEARSLSYTGSYRQEFSNEPATVGSATAQVSDQSAEARSLYYTGSYRQEFAR
jgi:hypothetical protein